MATDRALEAHAETHGPDGPLSRAVIVYQVSRTWAARAGRDVAAWLRRVLINVRSYPPKGMNRGHALTAGFDPKRPNGSSPRSTAAQGFASQAREHDVNQP